MILPARILVAGHAEGPIAALAPLSFWGGYDPVAGRVIDRSHPACGQSLAGVVLVMTATRGSSSSSAVLAEAIRLGTGPAALVLAEADAILTVGAMVAETLYGHSVPVVVLTAADHVRATEAKAAEVLAEGTQAHVRLL